MKLVFLSETELQDSLWLGPRELGTSASDGQEQDSVGATAVRFF